MLGEHMRLITTKRLRWSICLVFLVICLLGKTVASTLFVAAATLYSCLLFVAVVLGLVFTTTARAERLIAFSAVLWCILIMAMLSPVGLSLQSAPGLPHFVPYVAGLPGTELIEASERGECVLGGCCVFPVVPKWALVW